MAVSELITAMQSIFATPEYADRIPNSVKSVITAGNYGTTTFPTEIENAVYNVLVDKIGKQEIYKFEYNNFDASQYDKGYLPFGGIIEDDYVEAMKADEVNNLPTFDNQSDYEFVNYDPFKINYASIAPSYYTLKTLLQYHVTTAYDVFKRAFISEGYAMNFIQTIRSVLPESAKLDKYLIFRNMLASSTIYPSETDVSCVVAGSTMTAAESIQIVKTIRNYVEAFKWNTTKYNKQGKLVSSKKDDLVLFITAGIHNEIVSSQYNAYHKDLDFGCEVQLIDGFGTDAATTGQFATLADKRGIKIYRWLENRFDNIWNPYGVGYWNTFLTQGDLFGYSLHKNIIRFVLSDGK